MQNLRKSNEGYIDLAYSPSIDGLRATAILSVIAYHACSFVLPSGLVGVDIFFVISGFVVTASVLSHTFSGSGELLSFFFARRILRIAPALLVCIIVTTAATIAFIPEAYVSNTNLSTARAALFGVSNFILYGATDSYFAPRAELNPFTHTWSLAVEEQFYLLFPLLTAALLFICPRRYSRKATLATWGTLTAASVLVASYQSIHDPVAGFYLSPGRFWELGTGVLTYLALPSMLRLISRIASQMVTALAAAGLFGIGTSLVFAKYWAATYPFPGIIPAVIGAALVIFAVVAHPNGSIALTLARPLLVYVGRISYSLYLWHWPVFVLLRWTVGFDSSLQIVTGVVLSFSLAAGSYRWVEVPVRTIRWRRTRPLAVIASGLGCLALTAGTVQWATNHQAQLTASVTSDRYVWYPEGVTRSLPLRCGVDTKIVPSEDAIDIEFVPKNCAETGASRTMFVVGDSHAGAMMRFFANAAASLGITTRLSSMPGCGVLTLSHPNSAAGEACALYVRRKFEEIAQVARSGDVLFLPSLRLARLIAMDGGENTARGTDGDAANVAAALLEAEELLERFNATGVQVMFSAPLPIFRKLPYRCSDWFNAGNPVCKAGNDMARTEIEAMRAGVIASLKRLEARFSFVSVWDPLPTLCDAQTCSVMKDGMPLFFDGDHLSGWGDDVLYPSFIARIRGIARPILAGEKNASASRALR